MRPGRSDSIGKFAHGWPGPLDDGTTFEDALYCGSRVGLECYDGRRVEAVEAHDDEGDAGGSLHLDRVRSARARREAAS